MKAVFISKHSIASVDISMKLNTFALQNIKYDYGISLMYSTDL